MISGALQGAIADSRLEIIPDCGHYYCFEKLVELMALILDFARTP